jgi:RNA-binding protein
MPATTEPAGVAALPELSERQRRHLRGLAHALRPVIQIGSAGVTVAVTRETERALHDHELIKVRAAGAERAQRAELFSALARATMSVLVHRIGHVAVLYRPRPQSPGILLPQG